MADTAPAWDDLPSFDSLPDATASKGPAQKTAASGAPSWDDLPSWENLPHGQHDAERRPEAESPFVSGVREAAHTFLPGLAGRASVPLGVAGGAAIAGLPGAVVGGLGAFALGALAGDVVQDKGLKAVGFNDDPQRHVNRETNPKSSFAGGLLGSLATMSPNVGGTLAQQAVQRGAGAGAMGLLEAGGEKLMGEDLNPANIGMSMVAGAIAPGTNALGHLVEGPANKLVKKFIPGRPGVVPNPAGAQEHVDVGDAQEPQVAAGNAVEQGPVRTGETTGNPQSAPTRSERDYSKTKAPAGGDTTLTLGNMDPATKAALQQSTEQSAVHNDAVTEKIPEPSDGAMPGPGEPTGIAEAVAKMQKPKAGPAPESDVKDLVQGPLISEPGGEGEGGGHATTTAAAVARLKPATQEAIAKAKGEKAGGIPFMVTQAMKQKLGLRGYTPEQISNMTPAQAHEALNTKRAQERIDAGFPKEGDTVATNENPFVALSKAGYTKDEILNFTPEEITAKSALAKLQQPGKKGATKPNDELSDDQKRAGNYSKASVRDFSHDLKVETERGDMRRSLDDSPVKWEHASPADYGYFKKTIGADKDHVDFYRADPEMPEFGDKHFIVDQRNPETGKFDEHKVMNYFKDLDAARETYVKAFGDKSGPTRLHDITEISPEDLTKWLRGASKKKPFGAPMPKPVTVTVKKPKAPTGVAVEGGEGVTANTVEEAQRKAGALQAYKKVFDEHAPDAKRNSPETKEETIARARAAVEASRSLDKYPSKATVKQAPAQWLREASKIIRRPTDQMVEDFRANEVLLRSGDKDAIKDVRDTQRIKADSELARGRGGDAAELAEPKDMPEGAPEEPGTEMPPSLVKSALDLHKLITKNKELDLTSKEGTATVAADTKKITENLIRISDKPEPANRASEALSYVERGAKTKKPLKTEVGGKASEGRVLHDPEEIKRIVDAANERMAAKKAPLSKQELDALDLTKQRSIAPKDAGEREIARQMDKRGKTAEEEISEEGIDPKSEAATKKLEADTKSFLKKFGEKVEKLGGDTSGSLNHKKIAADFMTKGGALRQGLEKYFGVPIGEVGKKINSVLAKVVSTQDSLNAEKAGQLRERWFAWVKGTNADEQWSYLKTLEKSKATTRAGIEADLVAAGIHPDKAKWMSDEALFHKKLMDHIWLEDKKHGSKADYVQNYVAHIFKQDRLAAEFLQQQGVKNLGSTWYQKERTFELLEKAKAAGFELKFSNPIDLIQARWAASIKSNMLVAGARGLQDIGMAFPVKDAPKILMDREGWQFKRTLPDGQQWVFAPGAENLWTNAMEPKGLNEMQNIVGDVFRAWMGLKRVWAPIQLSFSAFHELHIVANINPAVNVARALTLSKHEFATKSFTDAFKASTGHAWDAARWTLRDPLLSLPLDHVPLGVGDKLDSRQWFSGYEGREAMRWWETPVDKLNPDERMWKNIFREGGFSPYQAHEDVIGARRDFAQAIADFKNADGFGHVGPAARVMLNGLARGIEKMQEPMFKYQIPALKNAAYMRDVEAAFQMDPSLATNFTKRGVVLNELRQNIDDRFGEMFYKGLFWNKTLKDTGIMSMLSMAWNLGQFRQVYGAAKNVGIGAGRLMGYKQKPMGEAIYNASDKATFVGAYIALSMLTAGAISYARSGQFPTGMDYIFPRNGQENPDKTPGRMSTPFNTREPFMLKAHAEQHNSWVGGAMEFMWNKMVLSPITEIAQNKDFYGRRLYDPNSPWFTKALQALDSTAGRMFNPISLAGADRAKEQGDAGTGQAMAFAGFNPAPKYVEATPMQNRINHLASEEGTPGSKPYEYGPKTGLGRGLVQGAIRSVAGDKTQSEARQEGRRVMEQGHLHNDPEAERAGRMEMIKEGHLSAKTASRLRPDTGYEFQFAKLPRPTQIALVKDMTKAEFHRYVLSNNQSGMSNMVRAELIKERSTNR